MAKVILPEDLSKLSAAKLRELEREVEEEANATQIQFVRGVVFEGMSQVASYEAAGYEGKNAESQAYKMMKRGSCLKLSRVYLEGLKRKALISANNLQLAAYEVLEQAMSQGDMSVALRAIDQLTKMTGQYPVAQQKIEVDDKREPAVPQMDQATLRAAFEAKRLQAVD